MILHDLKIVGNGQKNFKVYLDGKEVRGVTSVKFSNSVDDAPYLMLEMFVGTHEIEITEEENDGK